jgi:hypothetical protein
LDDSINTIKESTETLLEASRDTGLEINAEKTKYMSCHTNSGRSQNIRIANELFENVATFKYLGTTLTNQKDIHDEIKSRLTYGMLAIIQFRIFCLPVSYTKKLKTKIYKFVILPFVLFGCEAWSFTLKEEHRLRVFENRVLRKIFDLKRKKKDLGENCIMMNFTACILHLILLG